MVKTEILLNNDEAGEFGSLINREDSTSHDVKIEIGDSQEEISSEVKIEIDHAEENSCGGKSISILELQ